MSNNLYTVSGIILDAMLEAQKIQKGDDPDPEDYRRWFSRLQYMINQWMTEGLKLWLWLDKSIPLVAGTSLYTIKSGGTVNLAKPIRAIMGYFLDSSNNSRPIYQMSWEEYLRLGNRTDQGSINNFLVDKQASQLNVTFWMVPDATAAQGTAHLLLQQQVGSMVQLTDTVNFPQEWGIALLWGLADEMSTGQPQSVVQKCMAKAQYYKEKLDDQDVEDASTYLVPDSRHSWGSGFR